MKLKILTLWLVGSSVITRTPKNLHSRVLLRSAINTGYLEKYLSKLIHSQSYNMDFNNLTFLDLLHGVHFIHYQLRVYSVAYISY